MGKTKKRELKVECPTCQEKFSYYESKFRPFCCEKCRMIDLGQWFNEGYAIPSEKPLEYEDIDEIEKEWEKKSDGIQ